MDNCEKAGCICCTCIHGDDRDCCMYHDDLYCVGNEIPNFKQAEKLMAMGRLSTTCKDYEPREVTQ